MSEAVGLQPVMVKRLVPGTFLPVCFSNKQRVHTRASSLRSPVACALQK